jgi:hypothetical protein
MKWMKLAKSRSRRAMRRPGRVGPPTNGAHRSLVEVRIERAARLGLQLGRPAASSGDVAEAREVHPSDRQVPWDEAPRRFVEQALLDNKTALPGAIVRSDYGAARSSPSERVRLSEMEVNFEWLEMDYSYSRAFSR